MILKRLNVEIKKVINKAGIFIDKHVVTNEELEDVNLLWERVIQVLENMIIPRSNSQQLISLGLWREQEGKMT